MISIGVYDSEVAHLVGLVCWIAGQVCAFGLYGGSVGIHFITKEIGCAAAEWPLIIVPTGDVQQGRAKLQASVIAEDKILSEAQSVGIVGKRGFDVSHTKNRRYGVGGHLACGLVVRVLVRKG